MAKRAPKRAAEGGADEPARTESWIYLEVERLGRESQLDRLRDRLLRVLTDVRRACADWSAMRTRCREIIAELERGVPDTVDPATVAPTIEFLRWLENNHFTFLGYKEYELVEHEGEEALQSVPGSGLGILRDDGRAPTLSRLRPEAQATAHEPRLLTITKANSRSSVHRPVYLDYVGVRAFDEHGLVKSEQRFLGLFTASAYADSVSRLPVIGDKVRQILELSGFAGDSHSGKDLLGVLENFPRDELFHTPVDRLYDVATEVLHLQERRRSRLFLRTDEFGRFVTAMVYMPRDRFNTAVRLRIEALLRRAYGAESIDFTTRVGDSALAQVHYWVRMPHGQSIPEVDESRLEAEIIEATRSWNERLAEAVETNIEDEELAAALLTRYGGAFSEAYKDEFDAQTALADLSRLRRLDEDPGGPMPLKLYRDPGAEPGERRLKLYRDQEMTLTDVLPVFTHLGVEVTDERPYTVEVEDGSVRAIYDFGLRAAADLWVTDDLRTEEEVAREFEEAFAVAWSRQGESDSLNALGLTADLSWRDVVILRTLVRYLRQVGTFSLDYLEEALVANPGIARLVVQLFAASFDPDHQGERAADTQALRARVLAKLDDVASLDQDRIIRSLLSVLAATLRTNFYQRQDNGQPKPHVSLKLNSRAIEGLPEPRPAYEIWVYAPRIEGVHLRFGPVARGGLRWSDRREDFRTEILGLVKAQVVKNAVIVPTGSKGGFVAKQLPDPAVDREAWLSEGVGAYKIFIKGLLDITDNRVGGQVVPPDRVVRYDQDDPYLVVAADKGTATFSDIANGVSREYGFWLDDAFASGGSAGYDHKGMGITARGAWESVKRHFREMDVDTQSQDFTVVGIGDMSGDVFGNGMLLSEHIRLVAAFDHRHVFLDPAPDAAASFAERQRLFAVPRSSWADYDTALISEGGGVYPRSAKSVPVSPQVRQALGLDDGVESLTPPELLSAILRAPADLLWNGGIGTYVKASTESHAQIGDRANDAIRVDGSQLRVKVVGEGGNLGLSQRGRIEAATAGVRINTDAIDNSAGVDTSDHEVNIKIALSSSVEEGSLSLADRDALLASMTDEVAERVLRHNYEQNVLLGNGRLQSSAMLRVHERLMTQLSAEAGLDRALEALPDIHEVRQRDKAGSGLTSPEFSVLIAYSKLWLKAQLLESSLPDDPYLQDTLLAYFPAPLREQQGERLHDHPLRREIVVNDLANAMVNRGGVTFVYRAAEETAATASQVARAFVACRELFGLGEYVAAVEALDNQVDTHTQSELYLEFRRLMDRAVRWFLNNQTLTGDLAEEIGRFAEPMRLLTPRLPDLLQGTERRRLHRQAKEISTRGVPHDLAVRYAALLDTYSLLDIVELAEEAPERTVEEVAALYFVVSERFRIDALLSHVSGLARESRWDSLARGAMRDDLYGVLRSLTGSLLQGGEPGEDPQARVARWSATNEVPLARVSPVLATVDRQEHPDLAPLSVALRALRGLVRQGASG